MIDAVAARYRSGLSNTHGAFTTSEETDRVIADARQAARRSHGRRARRDRVRPERDHAAAAPLSVLGKTLEPGDEVVVTRLDHDANVRPWVLAAADAGAVVRWVDVRDEDVTIDPDSFDAALSPWTRLVAFTLASNAVGTIPPAADLVARAKERGGGRLADGVHLAQHRLPDLRGSDADVLACSPYKFFGPHLGILAARRELLESLTLYKLVPAPDEAPERWETGTQNHEGLAGLAAAVGYLADVAGATDGTRRDRLSGLVRRDWPRTNACSPIGSSPASPSCLTSGSGGSRIGRDSRSEPRRSRSVSETSTPRTRRSDWPRAASSSGTATTTPAKS